MYKRNHESLAAGSGSPSRPMHIGLGVGGRVVVQDHGDGIDMNPSGGDVCGYQGLYVARRKLIKSSRSLILRSAAVDGRYVYIETAQLLRESICAMACSTEDQSRRDSFQNICRYPQPFTFRHRPKEVARG